MAQAEKDVGKVRCPSETIDVFSAMVRWCAVSKAYDLLMETRIDIGPLLHREIYAHYATERTTPTRDHPSRSYAGNANGTTIGRSSMKDVILTLSELSFLSIAALPLT